MTEKLDENIEQMLEILDTQMERLFGAIFTIDRQIESAMQVFRAEVYRNAKNHTGELWKYKPNGAPIPVDVWVGKFCIRVQGLTLTVADAVIPTERLQASKDIICRSVWANKKWFENQLKNTLGHDSNQS